MSPQMSGRLALFTDLTSVTRVLDVTVCAVSRASDMAAWRSVVGAEPIGLACSHVLATEYFPATFVPACIATRALAQTCS
jgi:hypothetical protein